MHFVCSGLTYWDKYTTFSDFVNTADLKNLNHHHFNFKAVTKPEMPKILFFMVSNHHN